MRIYLIRHAQSIANAEKIWTGQRDVPLSPLGIAEQKKICARFSYPRADIYFSSPLLRCTQSFEIIYGRLPDLICNELTECALGVLEGLPYTNLNDDPQYIAWISNPDCPVEGGESFRGFTNRVCTGFKNLVAYCREKKINSAAGTMHGDVIRAILCNFVNPSIPHDEWSIPNGGMYILDVDSVGHVLLHDRAPDFLFSNNK